MSPSCSASSTGHRQRSGAACSQKSVPAAPGRCGPASRPGVTLSLLFFLLLLFSTVHANSRLLLTLQLKIIKGAATCWLEVITPLDFVAKNFKLPCIVVCLIVWTTDAVDEAASTPAPRRHAGNMIVTDDIVLEDLVTGSSGSGMLLPITAAMASHSNMIQPACHTLYAMRSRIFACGNHAGRWSACFLGDLPFSPPLHIGTASYSPHLTLIGSQDLDLDVESRPNIFTHSILTSFHPHFHSNIIIKWQDSPWVVCIYTLSSARKVVLWSGSVERLESARLPPRRTGFNPCSDHSAIFACSNRVGQCRFSVCEGGGGGFLEDLPFAPPFHSGAAPILASITLIGSQGLAVKSRPNIITYSLTTSFCRKFYFPPLWFSELSVSLSLSLSLNPPRSAGGGTVVAQWADRLLSIVTPDRLVCRSRNLLPRPLGPSRLAARPGTRISRDISRTSCRYQTPPFKNALRNTFSSGIPPSDASAGKGVCAMMVVER
ncbi:hypothetical protein PR048_023913 [Dryococelus australis]|uniref:Uncharacterized protein n=1 Tax=Dryococelus australis TaxID=614101 RepID=A0ABQ9GVD7_9NEOP|nr:hypothetical protein PR048_023913 [Dryococelus australis]